MSADPATTAPPDLKSLLALFPALQDLDACLAGELGRGLHWLRAPRNTQLFAAGEACSAFPLLLAGEVGVVRSTPDGHEIELYRIRPGESCIVSTSCLLGGAHYPARGLALADVQLAAMPHALFDRLVSEHLPFRRYVFALFAERLALMMQRIEDLAFRSLGRRIAGMMLASGADSLAITHERLAAQIGASREAVSRTLKKLEEAGCITLARGRIVVRDRARLAAAAESASR